MSSQIISVFAVLLNYSRDGVKRVLVALTPRSDEAGLHIPMMFIPESRMDIRIRRGGVKSGVSYYYGEGLHPWNYEKSHDGDIYFRDHKDCLTPKQRETVRSALGKLFKDIASGETEPKIGTLGPSQEVSRVAKSPSAPVGDFNFED